MNIPWPAWLGALAGTLIGLIIYLASRRVLEQELRKRGMPQGANERAEFELKLSAMRRGILAIEIAICAALGYWIGAALGAAASGAHF